MTADLLSAIVLLEPAQPADQLEEVLLSLAVQDYAPLQIVVACDSSQIEAVKEIAKVSPSMPEVIFDAIQMPAEVKDNNATRLNAALATCRGQYISILQTTDIVYGFAFPKLIDVLKKNSEPVAIGGTRTAYRQINGYIESKVNHRRAGKRTFDIWSDEDCARNFVIDKNKVKGSLSTESSLDYCETYFLLLALSLHNEFNFSLAADSLFERRLPSTQADLEGEIEKLKLRAQSKVIDWKSSQLKDALSDSFKSPSLSQANAKE